jgi:hypothetical protein
MLLTEALHTLFFYALNANVNPEPIVLYVHYEFHNILKGSDLYNKLIISSPILVILRISQKVEYSN